MTKPPNDVWMEAMARIDRGFHRECLAECLKTGINVTKPKSHNVRYEKGRDVIAYKRRHANKRYGGNVVSTTGTAFTG